MCSHPECDQIVTDGRWLSHFALQIARSSSWHARYTVLTYLQIMVFYNLFTFMSDQKSVDDVRALVVQLLEDEQLEVKQPSLLLWTVVKTWHPFPRLAWDISWKTFEMWTNTQQPGLERSPDCWLKYPHSCYLALLLLGCSDSALSSWLSTLFLPLWSSSCCYGNHRLQ